MSLRQVQFFDSLSRKKQVFIPRDSMPVSIYCCGPTVYGLTHIGNARAALNLDLITRSFHYFGFKTKVARNFTDIDDKIIAAAERESKSCEEIAKFYEAAYIQELKELKALEPDFTPRATETLLEIQEMIEGLIKKEMAYVLSTPNGNDVYFRANRFKDYGKLSHRKLDDLLEGTRADTQEGKDHPADFALWKAAKPGEPAWQSPWGMGRPGWHIECSAMIYKIFPEGIDIHMGGLDLIFPHHENEIAQSEGLHAKELSRYWIHNGMLEIEKEKMSKSLGNIMSTRRFLEDYGPETLRILMYLHHYRSPIDFSGQSLAIAEMSLLKLYQARERCLEAKDAPSDPHLKDLKNQIESALADDFNSAKALGFALAAARICFKEERRELWAAWRPAIEICSEVFSIFHMSYNEVKALIQQKKISRSRLSENEIQEIEKLLEDRQTLRAEKRFQESDAIRLELESRGILVMDTPEGSSWSVKT